MAVLEDTTRANLSGKNEVKQNADKKVFLAAQDIEFARCLAGNDKIARDRALKHLKKWLQQRSIAMPFTKTDFMLLWKGLFYSMWMSDKLLVQEECAENITNLIHSLSLEYRILFFQCGLRILSSEWFGIDQLRLDKFLMLARRLLRQTLVVLKNEDWNGKYVNEFINALESTVITSSKNIKTALGLNLHVLDIFMEELSKVSGGHLSNEVLMLLLTPFVKHLAANDDKRILNSVSKNIFRHLLWQSEAGIKFREKFDVWRSLRFPGGHISALRREVLSDDEDNGDNDQDDDLSKDHQDVLDPRAGKVDVVLPIIKFHSKDIADLLMQYKFKGSNVKSRKTMNKLIDEFMKMSRGHFPLGMHKVDKIKGDKISKLVRKSANKLIKFDNKIMGRTKKRGKSKEDNDDVPIIKRPKLNDTQVSERKRKMDEGGALDVKKRKMGARKQNGSVKENPVNLETLDDVLNKLEATFTRNSGTWHVFVSDSPSDGESTPKKLNEIIKKTKLHKVRQDTPINKINPKVITSPPDTIIDVPSTPPKKILFPQDEWDSPLNEGEYEFFVQSKKSKKKAKLFNLSSPKQVTPVRKLKGKNRHSLDSNIIYNPFSKPSGSSTKKVKIDLRLNKSQEIHEHEAQLRNSPAIPFDANKKPDKPLLKPNAIPSPINPFYKRKLNL